MSPSFPKSALGAPLPSKDSFSSSSVTGGFLLSSSLLLLLFSPGLSAGAPQLAKKPDDKNTPNAKTNNLLFSHILPFFLLAKN